MKFVAHVMSTYFMMCFMIPLDIVHKIKSVIAHFLWDQKCDGKRVLWLSWEKFYRPKREGG